MADETFASMKRSKLARKKRVRHHPKIAKTRDEGQESLPHAQRRIIDEKAVWKGGLTARKNVPEEFDDE